MADDIETSDVGVSTVDSVSAEIDRLAEEIRTARPPEQTQESTPVKKRGRRKKADVAPPIVNSVAPEAMSQFVLVCSHYAASRMGSATWIATSVEAKMIGEALDKVCAKYFPVLAAYQEETALGLLVGFYLLARLPALPTREEAAPITGEKE